MGFLQRVDPLALLGGGVALLLALEREPWWTVTGATTDQLLTVEVSPFFVRTSAVGLLSGAGFVGLLGSFAQLLLVLSFVGLAASSFRPLAWWRSLVDWFSLSSLAVLYLSFLLVHLSVVTSFLATYGVLPPVSGSEYLRASVVGLDLNNYLNPVVSAGFSASFYLGFFGVGLVVESLVLRWVLERGTKRVRRGVEAIFSPGFEDIEELESERD